MARIRNVKPEFFRHELLQELEISHPGAYCMLVYEALWGHADANGVFPWRPRQLKLDILPFLPFDMATTLDILRASGFIKQYDVDGKAFGLIPTFLRHQRLSGKEASNGKRYPLPSQGSIREASGKHPGSTGEILESQELGTWNLGEEEEEEEEKEKEHGRGGPGGGTEPPPPPPEGERASASDAPEGEPLSIYSPTNTDSLDDPREFTPVKIWVKGGQGVVISASMMAEFQNRFPTLDVQRLCEDFRKFHSSPGNKLSRSEVQGKLEEYLLEEHIQNEHILEHCS